MHKKSKWITFGIITYISYRDAMYEKLKMTDPESEQYMGQKHYLDVYNNILRKSIRLQINYTIKHVSKNTNLT